MKLSPLDRARRRLPVSLLAAAFWGCGPSPDDPLPPLSGDLHAYSLAVAEQARLKVQGDEARPLFNIGRAHERFGLEDKALEYYDMALAKNPKLADASRRKGYILSQRKDLMPEAIEAYRQALGAEPSFPGVLTRIGLVLNHLGRPAEAVNALQDEIRGGTASAETHYNLGEAYFMQEKFQEAAAAHREALRLAPEMREAHYGLASSLRALGDEEGSRKALSRFQEIKKREEERELAASARKDNRHSQLLYAAETWTDAAQLFLEESVRSKDPSVQKAMFSEATSALGNAVQIAPENVEAHKLIILLQRKRNDLRAAVLACEAALRAIPDEPFLTYTLAGLNIDLARREVEDQRDYLQRALSLLEKTVAKEPEFAEAHHDLALLILNSFPERKDLFPQALRHARLATEKTSSPRNYDLLSWAYARNGRTDLARQALEEGLKLFPQDAGLKQRSRLFEERKP